jgi:hypothetical protein
MRARDIGPFKLDSTPRVGADEYVWHKDLRGNRRLAVEATGPGLHQGDGWWVKGVFEQRAPGGKWQWAPKGDFFITSGVSEKRAVEAAHKWMRNNSGVTSMAGVGSRFKGSGTGYMDDAGGDFNLGL